MHPPFASKKALVFAFLSLVCFLLSLAAIAYDDGVLLLAALGVGSATVLFAWCAGVRGGGRHDGVVGTLGALAFVLAIGAGMLQAMV